MIEAMRSSGMRTWDGFCPREGESSVAFIDRILRAETLPEPGLVAESTFWATHKDRVVVGRISFRHLLDQNLREFGGNIGYEVHPFHYGNGFATEMLRQLLGMPIVRNAGKVLLTCAPTNTASIRVIEKCGGKFEKSAFVDRFQRETNYYWINV